MEIFDTRSGIISRIATRTVLKAFTVCIRILKNLSCVPVLYKSHKFGEYTFAISLTYNST